MCLPTLTYNEAWELSYFGANVLHPRTTLPAMRYKIPIAIRNFFNLDAPGGRAYRQGKRQYGINARLVHQLSLAVQPSVLDAMSSCHLQHEE